MPRKDESRARDARHAAACEQESLMAAERAHKRRRRRAATTATVLATLLTAASAEAGTHAWRPDGVYSQLGAGDATDTWSIGGQWQWRRTWTVRESLLVRGRWEFALGRWRTDLGEDGPEHAWVTQLSLVPTLRLSSLSQRGAYAEVGSGPSLLMPVFRSQDRAFSTEFNFQSHFAVGYVLGERGEHDFGVRIEHFSNAGIREPNPGMNLVSMRYTRRF
jgi:lipid A 3-O-deacylase